MDPITALIIGASCVGAFFIIKKGNAVEQERNNELSQQKEKLSAEVLEVFLLISQKCPANSDAHKLAIAAAKCLVVPASRFVQDYGARYNQGFEYLKKARELAGN